VAVGKVVDHSGSTDINYHSVRNVQTGGGQDGDLTQSIDLEVYFGPELPDGAGPYAILDDGTGFKEDRGDSGYDYGWDCDGDIDVDYSGGRRGTGRDGGLGINHFDRNGACATRVNWQIAVPNGEYTALVDFGEDSYTQGCETEGELCHDAMGGTGAAGTGCSYEGPVTVNDGQFTITGYSHDSGLCHSISKVRLIGGGGDSQQALEERTCEGSTLHLECPDGTTIDIIDSSYGRQHGADVCPHSAVSNQDCHEPTSNSIVSGQCQGNQACDVSVTNGVFGDPCSGTYKYLTVNYRCVTGTPGGNGIGSNGAVDPTGFTLGGNALLDGDVLQITQLGGGQLGTAYMPVGVGSADALSVAFDFCPRPPGAVKRP
jgi:hypothetical protein